MSQPDLRQVPSVEKLLHAVGPVDRLPKALVTDMVRRETAEIRSALEAGGQAESFDDVVGRLRGSLAALARTRLAPVINGTGVVLHTNLGRAPLSERAAETVRTVGAGYCNLEFSLDSGERGPRGALVDQLLALLCESEAAAVVNNCAAALVLVLRHFVAGSRREVIVSRGELIEIGGGFRIPDILETTGATLREVGTTNRTTAADYGQAVSDRTALILSVHRSNFHIDGFTASAGLAELAALGRSRGVPVVRDLGSGAMTDTAALNDLDHEPTAAETLRTGIDLVCISGDKLLGGPQAGIVAGRQSAIRELKQDPFFRVLRCDKLALTALQETAIEYLEAAGDPHASVPVLRMLALTETALLSRARAIAGAVGGPATIGCVTSRCGGGTMPRSALDSVSLDLAPPDRNADALARRLRLGIPPVIPCVAHGAVKIDLRTVHPDQDAALAAALRAALAAGT